MRLACQPVDPPPTPSLSSSRSVSVPTTTALVGSQTLIFLQTARVKVCATNRAGHSPTLEVRAILDLGSQRSYITARAREALQSENMIIKTFGSPRGERQM